MAPTTYGDRHRPLREVVCDAIRDRIVTGTYAPGSRLLEEQLASSLGVSRNPVREALRVLQTEGYVSDVPRRGVCVTELTDTQLAEVFEAQVVLEGLCWRLAAKRAGSSDLVRIRRALEDMRNARAASNPARWAATHRRFHALVRAAGHNATLDRLMQTLDKRMLWITREVRMDPERSIGDHERLLAAMEAGDDETVSRLAQEHILSFHERFWQMRQDGMVVNLGHVP